MPTLKFTTELLLELIVLTLIEVRSFPTSEILKKLNDLDFPVSSGSLYPLIARLNKHNFTRSNYEEMDIGRAQKCHSLTEKGVTRLKELKIKLRKINSTVYKAGK